MLKHTGRILIIKNVLTKRIDKIVPWYRFTFLIKSPKPERVNELRKKYEEFLEQDRKRKERNEYILGKFNKLRECTTVVHHNIYKPNFVDNLYKLPVVLPVPVPVGTPCRTIHSMPLQTATVNSTSSSFLDKILKKFILIPKSLPNSQENNTLQEKLKVDDSARALVDNADWKMKYEILNQLKQNEKEEPVSEKVNNVIDLSVDKKQDLPEKDRVYPDITSPLQNPIEYESFFYPDKDQTEVYGQFTNPALSQGGDPYSETVIFDYPIPPIEDQNNEIEIRPSLKGFQNKEEVPIDIVPTFQKNDDDRNDFKMPTEKIKTHEKIEYVDNDGLNPAYISYPSDDVGNPLGDIPKITEDMQYPKEVINVEEFTPRSDIPVKDGVNVNPEGYGMNKNHFEPFASGDPETTSVASRQQVENQGAKVHPVSQESQDTTNENFTANIIRQPEDQIQSTIGSEHVEGLDNNTVNMAGNEELVAQSDIVFYQEPTAESTFHQQAVEDVYEPNESYQQDSQYYYQGPHEVAEPVEINEHEETSSPYDPNYFQQYSNNYRQQDYPLQESEQTPQAYETQEVGYDQNQGYEGQQTYSEEAYNSSAVYETQQGYDEQQAQVYAQYKEGTYAQPQYQQEDSETVQHIEQQIRNEEGYPADNNEQPTEQISTTDEQKVSNQQQSQE